MNQYNAKYKPNQLICGTGQTAIITGWTAKNFVSKKLESSEYAVIGQLYSPTRGISFLVRNLLLNPHVRYLVVLNATREDANAGGCQCLLDFFGCGYSKGVSDTGKECWVVNSDVSGFIDIEISKEALDLLRESIIVKESKTVADAIAIAKSLTQPLSSWGEPIEFPLVESLPTVLPGTLYGHRIQGKTIAETWVKIIHRIKTTGVIRPTGYDGNWQELIDLVAIVTDEPREFYFPEPNYLPIDRQSIENYLPQILEDAPYQEGIKYTYGQRMRSWFGIDQIEEVIQKLIKEIDAASAVINLWDSGSSRSKREEKSFTELMSECLLNNWTEEEMESKFIELANSVTRYGRSTLSCDHWYGGSPCLNHIWIRVVDGCLSMTATFRSNDMFAAWASNAMGLRALQWHILDEINSRSDFNLQIAPLITISQSAHIYDDCWENADRLISDQYQKIIQKQDYFDPVGDFIIEVDQGVIRVQQTMSKGAVVAIYEGVYNNPLKLIRKICAQNPAIQPDHIGYLGMEIERAAKCLEFGRSYVQDKM